MVEQALLPAEMVAVFPILDESEFAAIVRSVKTERQEEMALWKRGVQTGPKLNRLVQVAEDQGKYLTPPAA